MPSNLLGSSFNVLKQTVDTRMKYQKVIAGNIANADTPGYVPRRIDFEKALANAKTPNIGVSVTHPSHISAARSRASGIIIDPSAVPREDGNGVDVDKEMVEMTTNQIMFDAGINSINKKLGTMHYVIQEVR